MESPKARALSTIDLGKIMTNLSTNRPFFFSEADFQHSLAWEIYKLHPESRIRLEFPFELAGRDKHLDIWIKLNGSIIAIELKYPTRSVWIKEEGQRYELKSQSAQDIGKYSFWKDVHRLESIVEKKADRIGYALLLSNDPNYWNPPNRNNTNDYDFGMYEGRRVEPHKLMWGPNTGKGTMKGYESPIQISRSYEIKWKDYSIVPSERYGKFRYLLLSIGNE